ncbi:poly(ADP-ribose) glycohydrolase-like [Tetranychus urticae]|nr:poly(ADP-ribose) glycohydrolase-like [Tetranychus urticae]
MENNLTDEDKDYFFEETLPKIIELVIQLPKLIRQPIPILKQKVNHSLYFSQQQIASLIANAFFCTFKDKKRTSSSKLLDINLIRLYVEQERFNVHHKILKLRCILNYFRRVTRNLPKGIVSFERRFLQPDEIPKWNKSNKNLTKIVVKSDKLIEKKGKGLLQVNSTYQLIGADFMNSDTRSQMIRSFLAYPELLMLRLFTELMLNNESLLIVGVEKFNRRSLRKGYYSNCVDKTQTDEWGRRYIKLLALDAKYFAWDKISNQYKKSYIDRELNKAYSGFIDRSESDPKHRCAIATGKWGCFNKRGDPQLKSLIQLLAASQAERDLMFCSLKDIKLADELKEMKKILIEKGLNVSQLYKILCQFDESLETEYPEKGLLFPYLTQQLSTFNANN